ncbi:hypothetical protein, partial [Streptomyces lancefieldiae]
MQDEVPDAALEVVLDGAALAAPVVEQHVEALGEERRLAQALGQRLEVEVRLLEDLRVGEERVGGARVVGVAEPGD